MSVVDFSQETFPSTGKSASGSIIFVKGSTCPLVIQPLSKAIYWWQLFDPTTKQARMSNGEKGSSRRFVFYGKKLGTNDVVPVVCGPLVWERILNTMQSANKLGQKSAYVQITASGSGIDTQYNVSVHSAAEPIAVPDGHKSLEEVKEGLLNRPVASPAQNAPATAGSILKDDMPF